MRIQAAAEAERLLGEKSLLPSMDVPGQLICSEVEISPVAQAQFTHNLFRLENAFGA